MRFRLFALLATVTLLFIACSSPPVGQGPIALVSQPTNGASSAPSAATAPLRIVTPFLSQPLDPAKGGGFNAIQFGVGETLMRLDESFTPIPWLASEITAVDELNWRVVLRAGASFHDGAPVDANAVKAALERAVAEIPTAATLLDLAAITVVDAQNPESDAVRCP
jgi:peptide/nickel transport system substrate-binding protein